jgi:hypothetical protein
MTVTKLVFRSVCKIAKEPISFVISVCLSVFCVSVCPSVWNNLAPIGRIFMKSDI